MNKITPSATKKKKKRKKKPRMTQKRKLTYNARLYNIHMETVLSD